MSLTKRMQTLFEIYIKKSKIIIATVTKYSVRLNLSNEKGNTYEGLRLCFYKLIDYYVSRYYKFHKFAF